MSTSSWNRFNQSFVRYPDLGFSIDSSRVNLPAGYFDQMAEKIAAAEAARTHSTHTDTG